MLAIVLALYMSSFFTKVTEVFVWIICYFFPAFFTLSAFRDRKEESYRKYLMYWIVYAFLWHCESILRIFIDRTFFNMAKIVISFMFLNSSYDLGDKFFESFLKPLISNNKITATLDEMVKKGE